MEPMAVTTCLVVEMAALAVAVVSMSMAVTVASQEGAVEGVLLQAEAPPTGAQEDVAKSGFGLFR